MSLPLRLAAPMALVALTACPAPESPPRSPSTDQGGLTVTATRTTEYRAQAGWPRPTWFRGETGVFVDPAARAAGGALPGIAFGTAEGPRYGLLGGYFAPLILAPASDATYAVRAVVGSRDVALALDANVGPAVLAARVTLAPGHARAVVRGGFTVALPGDRAELRATWRGRPAVLRTLVAGRPFEAVPLRADRVEVTSPRRGRIVIESDCPRMVLVQPVLRGSSSVVLLHAGANGPAWDPLWSPPDPPPPHPDLSRCPHPGTSTVSARPPG